MVVDGVTGRLEKRLIKRSQKFAKDHPVLMQVLGAGLAVLGASAATVPAVLAALGIKIGILGIGAAVVTKAGAAGTTSLLSTTAATSAATSAGGFLATGAKMLFGGIAMDVGGRMIEGPSTGPKRKTSTASIISSSGDMYVRDHRLKAL
jgi:hypothetical protein